MESSFNYLCDLFLLKNIIKTTAVLEATPADSPVLLSSALGLGPDDLVIEETAGL